MVVHFVMQNFQRKAAWKDTWLLTVIKDRSCVRIVTKLLKLTSIVGNTWKYINMNWYNGYGILRKKKKIKIGFVVNNYIFFKFVEFAKNILIIILNINYNNTFFLLLVMSVF